MKTYEETVNEIHARVLDAIDFSREMSDPAILDLIDDEILRYSREGVLSLSQMESARQDIFHAIRKLDVLQDLIEDQEITEIMINGPDHIFIEKDGALRQLDVHFASRERLENIIQQVVASCDRTVNRSDPIVDARLSTGERVNVVLPPVALNGPILTIRRFPDQPITMERLIRIGSISAELAAFLRTLVRAGYNIFISGGTGSGKTTFLNALSDFIPASERIITIEDNAELQIRHIDNLVRLEARNANVDGCRPVTIRDLIRSSLRMRPDRIIVGEVRGAEAIDMIQAMNTGHDGSMSTGHANSAKDSLLRLETMVLMGSVDLPVAAVRGQLASAIDIIVQLGRLRDRSRKVLEIAEVQGIVNNDIQLRTLYRFHEEAEENGRIVGSWKKENCLFDIHKLSLAGIPVPDPGYPVVSSPGGSDSSDHRDVLLQDPAGRSVPDPDPVSLVPAKLYEEKAPGNGRTGYTVQGNDSEYSDIHEGRGIGGKRVSGRAFGNVFSVRQKISDLQRAFRHLSRS